MSAEDSLTEVVGLQSAQSAGAADGDMMAFISNLIEQNAELTRKLQELASRTKLADDIVTEAHSKAEAIRLSADREANDRTAAIIRECEKKAKEEADRIVAEAQKQAEAIRTLKVKEANDRAAAIISESTAKAKLEADRILAEAKEQGHVIIEEETKKAQQYGLLIIDKAREKAISILDEANAQILALTSKSSQKGRR